MSANSQTQASTSRFRIGEGWLDESGVIWIRFEQSEEHTIEDAREVVSLHNELAAGRPRPIIADIRGTTTGADREAREHYVSEESARLKTAMAMLVTSPVQRMLGNFFFRMSRPPYPTRLFSSEQKALSWLGEHNL